MVLGLEGWKRCYFSSLHDKFWKSITYPSNIHKVVKLYVKETLSLG